MSISLIISYMDMFPPSIIDTNAIPPLGEDYVLESDKKYYVFAHEDELYSPRLVNSKTLREGVQEYSQGPWTCQPGHFILQAITAKMEVNPMLQLWMAFGLAYSVPFDSDKYGWQTSAFETTPQRAGSTPPSIEDPAVPGLAQESTIGSRYNLCDDIPVGNATCCRGNAVMYELLQGHISQMRAAWMLALVNNNHAAMYPKCNKYIKQFHCAFCHPKAYQYTWMTNKSHFLQNDLLKEAKSPLKKVPILQIIPCVGFVDKVYEACKNVPFSKDEWVVPKNMGKNEFRRHMGIPLNSEGKPIPEYPQTPHTSKQDDNKPVCFAGYD